MFTKPIHCLAVVIMSSCILAPYFVILPYFLLKYPRKMSVLTLFRFLKQMKSYLFNIYHFCMKQNRTFIWIFRKRFIVIVVVQIWENLWSSAIVAWIGSTRTVKVLMMLIRIFFQITGLIAIALGFICYRVKYFKRYFLNCALHKKKCIWFCH